MRNLSRAAPKFGRHHVSTLVSQDKGFNVIGAVEVGNPVDISSGVIGVVAFALLRRWLLTRACERLPMPPDDGQALRCGASLWPVGHIPRDGRRRAARVRGGRIGRPLPNILWMSSWAANS